MSDDLKKAFEEMKTDLRGVKRELSATREAFRTAMTAVDERMGAAEQRFDTFLVRFNEVSEMLITHDTEQLQRVARVERDYATVREENDALRQQWQDISRRVEALEKKAG